MKRTLLSLFLVIALALPVTNAVATILYGYVGPNYTNVDKFGGDVPGEFDLTMNVTGEFSVASPLTETAGLTDISGSLLGFRFSNGLSPDLTLANTGAVFSFSVDVDALGLITD